MLELSNGAAGGAVAEPQQIEIFDVAQVHGYGALKRRERMFVQGLFEWKSQRDAARMAGLVGTDEAVDAAASRLVRNATVSAVMNQAWARSGAAIEDTLRMVAELQRKTFNEAQAADSPEKRREPIRQFCGVTALIASIHGRLSMRIDGNVQHQHSGVVGSVQMTVPDSALHAFALIRRENLERARSQAESKPAEKVS
jgi:hypothetical protein